MFEELSMDNWISIVGYLLTILIVGASYHYGKNEVNNYQKRQDLLKRRENIRKVIVNFYNHEMMIIQKLQRSVGQKDQLSIEDINANSDLLYTFKLNYSKVDMELYEKLLSPYLSLAIHYNKPDFVMISSNYYQCSNALSKTIEGLILFVLNKDLLD